MGLEQLLTQEKLPLILGIAIPTTVVLVLLKKYFNGGVFGVDSIDLKGKFAVITGGNSGIGAQTTKYLARNGCAVIIGARDRKTAEEVIKECKQQNPSSVVQFIELNLASKESIQNFASAVSFTKIDYLINNAGLMAIPSRKTTKEGLEMQWGVNHLGHFYLTYLLWSKVLQSNSFRVINVSSGLHKKIMGQKGEPKPDFQNINLEKNYNPNISYSLSKLYNVLFTHALAERINPRQGKVLSLHPGVVRTNLMREMKSQGFGKMFNVFMFLIFPIFWFFTKSPWQGCQTTLYTLFSEEVENGCYYGDCKKGKQNSHATKQNWEKLWQISEQTLGITFKM